MRHSAFVLGFALLAACKPSSVTEAESKGDVKYLAKIGTPEAVAALGRLADKSSDAEAAIAERSPNDVNVYMAAWQSVLRESAWGPKTLRAALADPARAELAARAMVRKDPHLAAFTSDLDGALQKMRKSESVISVPSVLGSIGGPAQSAISARVADATTRGGMCRGLGTSDVSAESRVTFMRAPTSSRDDESCLRAASQMAQDDDASLAWLAKEAETGLLNAAGRENTLTCDRLGNAWNLALTTRPANQRDTLIVPLSSAIKRCPKQLDSILAASFDQGDMAAVIVSAIDPADPSTSDLKKTCARLPLILRSKMNQRQRERAADALSLGCARGK